MKKIMGKQPRTIFLVFMSIVALLVFTQCEEPNSNSLLNSTPQTVTPTSTAPSLVENEEINSQSGQGENPNVQAQNLNSNNVTSFAYPDTRIYINTQTIISPDPAPPSGSVTYTLTSGSFPEGISINASTGAITIGPNMGVLAETTYTITATPISGGSAKTATAKIEITSDIIDMRDYALVYTDTTTEVGVPKAIYPTTSIPAFIVSYRLTWKNGLVAPTGMSIDEYSGVITLGANAEAMAQTTFTVTAMPITPVYKYTKTATLKITIGSVSIDKNAFSYENIDTTFGTAKTVLPVVDFPATAAVRYALAPNSNPLPAGVTLNDVTGAFTVGSAALEQKDRAFFIVRATPTGNGYSGIKDAIIGYTVVKTGDTGQVPNAFDFSFSYSDISASAGTEAKQKPTHNFPSTATIRYVVVGTFPRGISIDGVSGEITVGANTLEQAWATYVIRASATGSHEGTKDTSVRIKVNAVTPTEINIENNIFSYIDIVGTFGTAMIRTPTALYPSAAEMRYSVVGTTLPTGITLNELTGKITVGANVAVQGEETYTINARATGSGYTGSKSATVKIEIRPAMISGNTFSYNNLSTIYGTAATREPNTNFPVAANVRYSLASNSQTLPSGISLDATTGRITVSASATAQSQQFYVITASPAAGTNYTGTATTQIGITVERQDISSKAFSYADVLATFGSTATRTPSQSFPSGATVRYEILGGEALPSGISLNQNTGEIIVGTNTAPQDEKTYRITATGTGNYKGTKQATVKITVDQAAPTEISIANNIFSYIDIVGTFGTAMTRTPTAQYPSAAEMRYSVVGTTLPTGITLNELTGKITVGANVGVQGQETYTINARATGSGYTGSKSATVKIEIRPAMISSNTFSYDNISTIYGTVATREPNTSFPAAANVRYSLASNSQALPSGISLDATTGRITVWASATAQSQQFYIITASPAAGTNYTGTATTQIGITVERQDISSKEFSYVDILATFSSSATRTPSQSFPSGATVRYEIFGGEAFPTGISLNQNTGEITVVSNTALQDEKTYRITATGTGNYRGTKLATVKITVINEKINISKYGGGYLDMHALDGQTIKQTPNHNFPANADVRYAISGTSLPTGITLNEVTGEIIIGTTTAALTRAIFVIRVTPRNINNYTGQKYLTAVITVGGTDISTSSFSYSSIITDVGTAITVMPTDAFPDTASISYAVVGSTLPSGITLNANTGEITVSASALAQSQTSYLIRATASGSYTGKRDAVATVAINE